MSVPPWHMDASRAASLFQALTAEGGKGYPPFRWQMRLLRDLVNGDIPRFVDIPTGLGKTSVMALWLIALAEGAHLPRRLVYVVDRRAVVDQATRFAEQIRKNLPPELASRLQLNGRDLPISTLRGGFADNRDWLEDPASPAIIVGTVDMTGSRLLFQGYGVSSGMRPYHAGLLGVDSLVLLDEAHLCPPFEALLRQIEAHRNGKLGPASESDHEFQTPPFRLMSLSATGRELREISSDSVFGLEEQDRQEALVRQRLEAQKHMSVHEIGRPDQQQVPLDQALAERALALADTARPSRILVFCDSRTVAVKVKNLIDKECRRRDKSPEASLPWASELLVGERRVYERALVEDWLQEHGFIGESRCEFQGTSFLVATSAGEVGVDIDADHLACDLVAFERMVQRLGRVNRRGGEGRIACVDVCAERPKSQSGRAKAPSDGGQAREEDPKQQRFNAWRAALGQLPGIDDHRQDASPLALTRLKETYPKVVAEATSPAPLYPEVTRALVDAWSMTSLSEHEGCPEVAPWLRGWEEEKEEPQVQVVWRTHLPTGSTPETFTVVPSVVTEFFRCTPVHSTEKLEAPASRVMDWIFKRATRFSGSQGGDAKDVVAILLDRKDAYIKHATPGELTQRKEQKKQWDSEWKAALLPGSVLIVDARMGGLKDGLLDHTSADVVPSADADDADPAWAIQVGFKIVRVNSQEDAEGLSVNAASPEGHWRFLRSFETESDARGVARRGLAVFQHFDAAVNEDGRSIASRIQTLADHAREVEAEARKIAHRLELPEAISEALGIAARLHDHGKSAERWQNAMNAPKDEQRPYAKTSGGGNWRLLEGYRHEFGSLLEAEQSELPQEIRDLILHLIAAHHGNARPLISSAGCETGPPSVIEAKAGEAALRFARIQKRFGPWGLAWCEAILRAADQRVSRRLNLDEDTGNG